VEIVAAKSTHPNSSVELLVTAATTEQEWFVYCYFFQIIKVVTNIVFQTEQPETLNQYIPDRSGVVLRALIAALQGLY